jgi:ubiquinol-cytochrome c reductase cytochrome c subunit
MDTVTATRRRRLIHVGIIAVALGVIGMLYTALAPSHSSAANSDPTLTQGRELFLKGCASCHGLNGSGGTTAPSLVGVGGAAADFQLATGRMPLKNQAAEAQPKRPQYTDSEIEALSSYVASLGAGPPIPTDLNYQNADTAFGGALFRTNCAQCHNFAGSGGALTYGKYAPSLAQATPKEIYEAMITGPESMPVFGDQQISASEKLAIINYIRTIQTEPNPGGAGLGRVGPVSETAIAWLVGIGILVVVTMWIGSRT